MAAGGASQPFQEGGQVPAGPGKAVPCGLAGEEGQGRSGGAVVPAVSQPPQQRAACSGKRVCGVCLWLGGEEDVP